MLVIIYGILESTQMVQIYENGWLSSAQNIYGTNNDNWELLEDGEPKNTKKLIKAWQAKNGVQVMERPANS